MNQKPVPLRALTNRQVWGGGGGDVSYSILFQEYYIITLFWGVNEYALLKYFPF